MPFCSRLRGVQLVQIRHAPLFTIRLSLLDYDRAILHRYDKDLVKVGDSVAEVTETLFEIYFRDLFLERITTILFVARAYAWTHVTTFGGRLAARSPLHAGCRIRK